MRGDSETGVPKPRKERLNRRSTDRESDKDGGDSGALRDPHEGTDDDAAHGKSITPTPAAETEVTARKGIKERILLPARGTARAPEAGQEVREGSGGKECRPGAVERTSP